MMAEELKAQPIQYLEQDLPWMNLVQDFVCGGSAFLQDSGSI
jgi:hypothetical protein